MRNVLFLILALFFTACYSQSLTDINESIKAGQLSKAKAAVKHELAHNDSLSQYESLIMKQQLSRINVILDDYCYTYEEMFARLKKDIPDLSQEDVRNWEADTSLEYHLVDGKKMYYVAFPYNLFKLCKEAEQRRVKDNGKPRRKKKYDHIKHKKAVIREAEKTGFPYVLPKRVKVCMTFFEKADGIPDGTVIRGWLPVARDIEKQQDITLTSVHPEPAFISNSGGHLNASVYVEKQVNRDSSATAYWRDNLENPPQEWRYSFDKPERFVTDDAVLFQIIFEYTACGVYRNISPADILPFDTSAPEYTMYTREEEPHLKFTPALKTLSRQIIGNEENYYLKAKKIYEYICRNVPWTSPDYSSADCLADNIAKLKRGDCGSKAFLFVALCRLNGIPARLQGGWLTRPFKGHTQHGWAQMYVEPYGWLTVDPDAGSHLIDNKDDKLKYFHFGNCESYRLIVYDDTMPLFPLKIHGSNYGGNKTGGLQLGAFEWAGGELEANIIIDTDVEDM